MANVKKKDSRKKNSVTKKDAFALPMIDGLLSRWDRTRFISSQDQKETFWQIALDAASKALTAFTLPGRPLYHFKVMSFGFVTRLRPSGD